MLFKLLKKIWISNSTLLLLMCKCSFKELLLSWIPHIWIWVIARFFLDALDQLILGCNSEFRTVDTVFKYNIARIALYMNINFNISLILIYIFIYNSLLDYCIVVGPGLWRHLPRHWWIPKTRCSPQLYVCSVFLYICTCDESWYKLCTLRNL